SCPTANTGRSSPRSSTGRLIDGQIKGGLVNVGHSCKCRLGHCRGDLPLDGLGLFRHQREIRRKRSRELPRGSRRAPPSGRSIHCKEEEIKPWSTQRFPPPQRRNSLNRSTCSKSSARRTFGPWASASFSSASSWVGTTPRARAALSAR